MLPSFAPIPPSAAPPAVDDDLDQKHAVYPAYPRPSPVREGTVHGDHRSTETGEQMFLPAVPTPARPPASSLDSAAAAP